MSLLGRIADWKRLRLVRSHVSKGMEILDLGCGSGWLVEALRNEGHSAIGIDPNLPGSVSRSYLLKRSAYETGFRDGRFDCVICLETIEHLQPEVFGEIARVSREGAKLILTTPKKRWNWFVELLSSVGLADSLVTPHINLVCPHDLPFVPEETGSFMFFEWYGVYRIHKK